MYFSGRCVWNEIHDLSLLSSGLTRWATGTCKHLHKYTCWLGLFDYTVRYAATLPWQKPEYKSAGYLCILRDDSLPQYVGVKTPENHYEARGRKGGLGVPERVVTGTDMVPLRFRSGSDLAPTRGYVSEPVPKLAAIWVIAWGREGPLSQMWRPQECHPKTCHLHPAERDCSSAAISASLLCASQPPLKWAEMKWTHSGTGAPMSAAILSI